TDDDPQRNAYDALQSLVQTPMKLGAQRIDLRPVEGGAVQRYTVDGVTLEGRNFTRDLATSAIELTKQLAELDPADRRKPQTSKIKIQTEAKVKHDVDVYTAGSSAGEMLKLQIDFKKQYERRVDTLGLLKDQNELLLSTVSAANGVVILTAPEGHGLTNLAYAILRQHDAFLSQIMSIEHDPEIEIEGVKQNKLAANAPAAEESKLVNWLISQEPDVIFVDRIDDPQTAAQLAQYAKEKRVYVTFRAPTTFDALSAWRKLVGDDQLAVDSVRLVVAERLVRVLCEACKIGYTPDADSLKKMNMSPERVTKLFQARKEPMRDQKGQEVICPFCHGLAYKGRTGVFEMFKVDDEIRQTLLAGGSTAQLKPLFRKQRQRYLQEAALSRVEKGDTSVEEVLRVLRSPSSGSRSRTSA
ncbi:MAG TPA: ATPase, T2SS/T4P/T4SS family, partial [Tepidisphaeraceae bacterium]